MTDSMDEPEWRRENEAIRAEMDLPEYEPPRFEDGVYVHDVIPEIEERYDVTVQFIGVNTKYGDDWEVRVNFEPVRAIGRHRDKDGNTVFEATAADVVAEIESSLEGH